jgi:hypothetical protein
MVALSNEKILVFENSLKAENQLLSSSFNLGTKTKSVT